MQYSVKALLLLLAFGTFAVGACKDDEKSNAELLTAVSCWQQTKSETLDPSGSNQWEEEAIDDCSKDDCYAFKSGNVSSFDEGATKCAVDDPQTETGTWVLTGDDKTLTFTAGGIGLSGTITELTESKLVIEIDIFGIKYRTTFTAK